MSPKILALVLVFGSGGAALAQSLVIHQAKESGAVEPAAAEQIAADDTTPKADPAPPPPPAMQPTVMSSEPVVFFEDPVQGGRFWAGADFLTWFSKSSPTPTVISGPLPAAIGGSTQSLFGGILTVTNSGTVPPLNTSTARGLPIDDVNNGVRYGFDLEAGGWLDPERSVGVEFGYFLLPNQSSTDRAGGPGVVAIPYTNALTGKGTSYILNQPTTTSTRVTALTFIIPLARETETIHDTFSGGAAYSSSSTLQGADANGIWRVAAGPAGNLDFLAGFRYAQLDEQLAMGSTVTDVHTDVTAATVLGFPAFTLLNNFNSTITREDDFTTHNYFYGGQVGARAEYFFGRMSVLAGVKLAIGDMHQVVDISGATNNLTTSVVTASRTITLAGVPITVPTTFPPTSVTSTTHTVTPGGLFAQPTNIGSYSRDVFEFSPELDFKIGYQITSRLRATVGYSFFYFSDVARPGDQVDRTINPNQLASPPSRVGPALPAFQFSGSDFWAQGLDFGLEFRF
jgi:hypothetical protein